MNKLNIALLFGGRSPEHEVSLESSYSILQNISREKYNIIKIGVTKDGRWLLYEGDDKHIKDGDWALYTDKHIMISPDYGSDYIMTSEGEKIHIDAFFPMIHGEGGEDGSIAGMLHVAKIPFVGPGHASLSICMDKAHTKRIVSTIGIRQAASVIFDKNTWSDSSEKIISECEKKLGYPIFVKPSRTGSSVGISKAVDRCSLVEGINKALLLDTKVIAEEFIDGREIEVAVLEKADGSIIVSQCGEIDPGSEFYDYDTKYINDTAKYYIPARLSEETAEKIRRDAEEIFKILDCRGLSRIDFFAAKNGEVIFNEINTLPGFTSISMYPKLICNENISYSELIDLLIEEALKR